MILINKQSLANKKIKHLIKKHKRKKYINRKINKNINNWKRRLTGINSSSTGGLYFPTLDSPTRNLTNRNRIKNMKKLSKKYQTPKRSSSRRKNRRYKKKWSSLLKYRNKKILLYKAHKKDNKSKKLFSRHLLENKKNQK